MARTKQQHNDYHRSYYNKNKTEIRAKKLERLNKQGHANFYHQNLALSKKTKEEFIKNIDTHQEYTAEEQRNTIQPPHPDLKEIKGYDKRYYANKNGIIYAYKDALKQYVEEETTVSYTGNLLIELTHPSGRKIVKVVKNLVAETWGKKCSPGSELRHINGEKLDNDLTNLRCYRKKN